MKDRVSVLVDGELDARSAEEAVAQLERDAEGIEAWRTYHLIGDAMRGTAPLSEGFAARVAWKLADEPTVLAPGRIKAERRGWFTVSAMAASLAAVALVGWVAFAPRPETAPAPVAQAPQEAKPVAVPVPAGANDYLFAHQGFSPRIWLPHVQTVADHRETRQ